MLIRSKRRGSDSFGSGDYGAPRGSRTHKGEDFLSEHGDQVCSHVQGEVTKIGYPYGDDLSYRYVEVTSSVGFSHRFFYVEPSVKMGDHVVIGEVLGTTQDLDKRYKGIPNHYHYEVVKYESGKKVYQDPNGFLLS